MFTAITRRPFPRKGFVKARTARFLVVLGFLISVGTGLIPTARRLQTDYRNIRSHSYDSLRRTNVVWYRRLEECFKGLSAQLGEEEIVLLSVDQVPHWFAPYYLAPRPFYYLTPETEAKLQERGLPYRRLHLMWVGRKTRCELSKPIRQEGDKGQ